MGRRGTPPSELTGQRFGRLVVLRQIPRPEYYSDTCTWWVCRCDCGAEVNVRSNALKTGNTRSCGCLARELSAERCRTRNEQPRKKKGSTT